VTRITTPTAGLECAGPNSAVMTPRPRRHAAVIAGVVIAATATLPAIASPSSPQRTAPSAVAAISALPSWALGRKPAATEPPGSTVRFALMLRTRNQAALKLLDTEVSSPTSANYRHFLTTAQYDARFAPTAATATQVTSWLRAAGLTVDGVTPGRTLVYAHGSAATVGQVFATSFGQFRVNGSLLRSPLAQPRIPAALSSVVAGVDGLAQTEMTSTADPSPAFINARPCSTYYGRKTATKEPKYDGKHEHDAVCGYTPAQVRSAYGLGKTSLKVGGKTLTGKGVTVAIVDAFASPTIEADTNTYSKRHGLPQLATGQLTQTGDPVASSTPEVNPSGLGVVDPQGWAGEETLDVEAVHTFAPDANIEYVAAAYPEDVTLFTALAQAIEAGGAQIVSNSYGSEGEDPDPADLALFNTLMSEAAAKGVTVDFSAGDSGDEVATLGDREADFPATSTGVTAVGGTTLEVNKAGKATRQTYWGTEKTPMLNGKWDYADKSFSGAGGGGVSTSYAEPAWQKAIVPTSEATYGGVSAGRVEPDLSMIADPTTGFLMGQTETFSDGATKYGEYRIGGTSVSCPMFSGVLALADQLAGKGLGLITPTLYKDAGTTAGREKLFTDPSSVKTKNGQSLLANVRPDFTDTTNPASPVIYSLRTLGNLGTLHALKGFDDSTGLGAPKAGPLVQALG
jgi:subtilase family serine protease